MPSERRIEMMPTSTTKPVASMSCTQPMAITPPAVVSGI